MKLVNSYKAVTIESSITAEDFRKVCRIDPKALTLFNEEDKAVLFQTGVGSFQVSHINEHAICFDSSTEEGNLYITVACPELTEDTTTRKAELENLYGTILYRLKMVEDQVATTLSQQSELLTTISNNIII